MLLLGEQIQRHLQIACEHPLKGTAIEADDLRQHHRTEQGLATTLLLEHDLQQDRARDVGVVGGIEHLEADTGHHQLTHI